MDCVVRADAVEVGVIVTPALIVTCKTGTIPTVSFTQKTTALTARPLSIGNCSLSAVPADSNLLMGGLAAAAF